MTRLSPSVTKTGTTRESQVRRFPAETASQTPNATTVDGLVVSVMAAHWREPSLMIWRMDVEKSEGRLQRGEDGELFANTRLRAGPHSTPP